MEYLNEILWWALASGGALMGNFGGGGSAPQPPKPDFKQSEKLTRADYSLKREFIPKLSATAGQADRVEYERNLNFAVKQLGNSTLTNRVNRAMPEVRQKRRSLQGQLDAAQSSSAEYRRAQTAMQRGLKPQQVGQRSAATSQAAAARMEQVNDAQSRSIAAGQVGAGALGETLMGRAEQMAQSTGRLSAEADRDAVQSARQGMAARGMATGSAALGAELLNRDQYARQRQFQDLGFAQGVQGQDLTRQFQNVGNRLTADQSNQASFMQAELANQQTRFGTNQFNAANQQQANLSNTAARNTMAQFNAGLGSSIDQFNAGQRTDAGRYNMGLLGTASQMADAERGRRLGLGQDAYNFALSSNPNMVAMGLGSGYANMTAPSMSLMGGQNMQMMYSGGQFSSGGSSGSNAIMGAAGGALSGAAAGSVLGPWGTAGGALVGGLGGYFASQ